MYTWFYLHLTTHEIQKFPISDHCSVTYDLKQKQRYVMN